MKALFRATRRAVLGAIAGAALLDAAPASFAQAGRPSRRAS
jgi:hypothetical protein